MAKHRRLPVRSSRRSTLETNTPVRCGSMAPWCAGAIATAANRRHSEGGPFQAVSAGWQYTCAVRVDGSAVCRGWNQEGQSSPPAAEEFIAISSGAFHTCALRADGSPVCWGYGGAVRTSPPDGDTFTAISNGGFHTCRTPRGWLARMLGTQYKWPGIAARRGEVHGHQQRRSAHLRTSGGWLGGLLGRQRGRPVISAGGRKVRYHKQQPWAYQSDLRHHA